MAKKGKSKGKARAAVAEAPLQRAYEAGRHHRRLANWMPSRASINQMLAADGPVLLARARDLCRNNAYAASAKESFVANLIGTGIKPSPLVADAGLKDALQQAWLAWTDEADADGLTDFYGLQALIGGALFEAGECFVRFVERDMDEGLSVPLQLQVLESEMVPVEMNEVGPNGNDIVNGIEFDAANRRVAYWMWTVFPGDPRFRRVPEMRIRVPADEVLHVFKPARPGAVRGQPWITPSIIKLWLLDGYDDAELDRKKTAAMYAGFITSPMLDAFKQEFDPDLKGAGPNAQPESGVNDIDLQPGTMQGLLPGEDIKFSEPADVGGSYEAFQYRNLLAASTGMGTPYSAVTGDTSKNNYSSMRGGAVESRRRLEQLQHGCIVFQLCRPVWKRWTTLAVVSGAVEIPGFSLAPGRYQAVKWIAPRFEWVDPLKDLQSEDLAVSAGFKARSTVIESMGEDPEEVDRRIAADKARADRLGLDFTARPAPVSVPAAGEAPEEDEQDDDGDTPPAPAPPPRRGRALKAARAA